MLGIGLTSLVQGVCDRVTDRDPDPKNKRPGRGPLNEQMPKIHLLSYPHTPASLFPHTRLRRVRFSPPFLSFNTFTSILNHGFLLFLHPFLCADPSFCRLHRPHIT
jgi:hypothetical protein